MKQPLYAQIFCCNLCYLRWKNEYSLSKMAAMLHISIKTLRRIKAGEIPGRVSCDTLFWAQKSFRIPFQELLGRDLTQEEPHKA